MNLKQLLRNNKLSAYIIFLFLLTLLVRIVLVFYYKSNAAGGDFNVIYGIQRLIAGQKLYQDPEQAPFALVQYTPLHYYIVAGLCRILHITTNDVEAVYTMSRATALLCNLGTILLAAAATSTWTHKYRKSLVYALPAIMILTNHYLCRTDSMQLFFFMLSLYLFLRYLGTQKMSFLLYAAIGTACCILSKQNGILLPLIICFYLALIRGKWLQAFVYGIVSVVCFGALVYWFSGGDFTAFYKNAYLGLKNGFDPWYPVTIFTSQFYFDFIPCYFLGGILFYFLFRRADTIGETSRFLAWGMMLSFFFAIITGLKIGSSNNYFTEFLLFLVLLMPGLADEAFAQRILFRIRGRKISVIAYARFCFVILLTSKTLGLFSSVFIERWFKNEKPLYTSGWELRHYFEKELKLQPGQYVYFSTREFLDNIFFDHSIMPDRDVISQVYLANARTIDYSAFTTHMNDGLVSYVVAKAPDDGLNTEDAYVPFVHFDEKKFRKIGVVAGYTVYAFSRP